MQQLGGAVAAHLTPPPPRALPGAQGLGLLAASALPTTLEDVLAVGVAGLASYIAVLNLPLRRATIKQKVAGIARNFVRGVTDAMKQVRGGGGWWGGVVGPAGGGAGRHGSLCAVPRPVCEWRLGGAAREAACVWLPWGRGAGWLAGWLRCVLRR